MNENIFTELFKLPSNHNIFNLTDDVYKYLDLVYEEREKLIIVISVKDIIGYSIKDELSFKLRKLGISSELSYASNKLLTNNASFCAIIKNGTCISENLVIGDTAKAVFENIEVISQSLLNGNVSRIIIDGTDYSANERGLNIVLLNSENKNILDCVSFDTHSKNFTCTHRFESINFDNFIKNLNDDKSIENRKLDFFLNVPKASDSNIRLLQEALVVMLDSFHKICSENDIKYWLNSGSALGAIRHKGFIPWDDDLDVGMMYGDYIKLKNLLSTSDKWEIQEWIEKTNYIKFKRDGGTQKCFKFVFKQFQTPLMIDIFTYVYVDDCCKDSWNTWKQLRECINRETLFLINENDIVKDKYDFLEPVFHKYRILQEKLFNKENQKNYIMWSVEQFLSLNQQLNTRIYPSECFFPTITAPFENLNVKIPHNPIPYFKLRYGDYLQIPQNMLTKKHYDLDNIKMEQIIKFLEFLK
ncbi:MAG: LicD family protein [Oscillospiraceae bacterium]|jgi:lipopolysaccharide cholinephosphotransferase|nr:LicD family protein [Oscillospiraceae bacterium]